MGLEKFKFVCLYYDSAYYKQFYAFCFYLGTDISLLILYTNKCSAMSSQYPGFSSVWWQTKGLGETLGQELHVF